MKPLASIIGLISLALFVYSVNGCTESWNDTQQAAEEYDYSMQQTTKALKAIDECDSYNYDDYQAIYDAYCAEAAQSQTEADIIEAEYDIDNL